MPVAWRRESWVTRWGMVSEPGRGRDWSEAQAPMRLRKAREAK